jgi:hypothetical protein
MCGEVRVHAAAYRGVSRDGHVSGAAGESEWRRCLATTTAQCPHADQPATHGTDARPPSTDAGSVWSSEDVAVAHPRRPGLRPPSGGSAQAGGGERRVAPTALCPHGCRCTSTRRRPFPIASTNSLPCRRRIGCGRAISRSSRRARVGSQWRCYWISIPGASWGGP